MREDVRTAEKVFISRVVIFVPAISPFFSLLTKTMYSDPIIVAAFIGPAADGKSDRLLPLTIQTNYERSPRLKTKDPGHHQQLDIYEITRIQHYHHYHYFPSYTGKHLSRLFGGKVRNKGSRLLPSLTPSPDLSYSSQPPNVNCELHMFVSSQSSAPNSPLASTSSLPPQSPATNIVAMK